jgi:hypothetical protein
MDMSIAGRLRRLWCAIWGHDWERDERGAPVIPAFVVCLRCGKWAHLL